MINAIFIALQFAGLTCPAVGSSPFSGYVTPVTPSEIHTASQNARELPIIGKLRFISGVRITSRSLQLRPWVDLALDSYNIAERCDMKAVYTSPDNLSESSPSSLSIEPVTSLINYYASSISPSPSTGAILTSHVAVNYIGITELDTWQMGDSTLISAVRTSSNLNRLIFLGYLPGKYVISNALPGVDSDAIGLWVRTRSEKPLGLIELSFLVNPDRDFYRSQGDMSNTVHR